MNLLDKYNSFHVRVGKCKYGRGVFATKDFAPGALIEVCPIIVLSEFTVDMEWIRDASTLQRYYFNAEGRFALALGYGALYNHSKSPNADYTVDIRTQEVPIYAVKKIRKGTQILIDYGYDPKTLPGHNE